MRGKRYVQQKNVSHEFELDLAPLLSVMVKLVPVLLLSTAFAQVMTIESDLPGSLQRVVEESHQQKVQIKLQADAMKGIRLVINGPSGGSENVVVPSREGHIDYDGVHSALVEIKRKYPQVFHLMIQPSGSLSYQEVVRLMDESRKAKDASVQFTYTDPEKGEGQNTQWMFPEVMLEPSEAT